MGAGDHEGESVGERESSESLQRAWSLDALIETQGYWFQASDLHNCKRIPFCYFSHQPVVTAAMGTRYDVFI